LRNTAGGEKAMSDLVRGTIIGGVFTLLTVIIPFLLRWRNNKADEQNSLADVIVKSAQALDITSDQLIEAFKEVKQLRAELDAEKLARRLESEKFTKDLRRWGRYTSLLVKQLIEAGLEPVPFPPDSDPQIKGVA
jgi:hypothetical protein